VEAGKDFTVRATSLDGKLQSTLPVKTESDNVTVSYLLQGPNTALLLGSVDKVAPFVLSTTPVNLADIAAGSTAVVFTFSEPIKASGYALALTEAASQQGGLWQDVTVNYIGPKVGNMPYTLAWNADMTALTVTLNTAAASKYTVSILNAVNNTAGYHLTDSSKNPFASIANTTVNFTTSGGSTVTAPVVTRTSDTTLDWKSVTNAYQYLVKVERIKNGVSEGVVDTSTTSDTHFDLTTSVGFLGFADNQVPVSYKVTVASMSTANVVSDAVAAAPQTLSDTTKPTVVVNAPFVFTNPSGNAAVPGLPTAFEGQTKDYTFSVSYSETMAKGFILDKANWSISTVTADIPATATHATITKFAANTDPTKDILPTVKSVTNPSNDGQNFVVTLTFTQNTTKDATTDMDAIQITIPGTDVNLNALKKSIWVGQAGVYN
jgi:hypothetical protein